MEGDEKRRRSLCALPEETEVLFSYLKETHTADTHIHTHSYKHTTAACVDEGMQSNINFNKIIIPNRFSTLLSFLEMIIFTFILTLTQTSLTV